MRYVAALQRRRRSTHGQGTAGGVGRERGAALIELAIALPILLLLLTLIFDAGLGFSAARATSSAARSAARVASGAGAERYADYLALDAVRSQYDGSGDQVAWVSVYRSVPDSGGVVPAGCGAGGLGVAGLCNVYPGSVLDTLAPTQFEAEDCVGDPDSLWCPTTREANVGDFLGVAVWSSHEPTIGLVKADAFDLQDHAVFAIFLAQEPAP